MDTDPDKSQTIVERQLVEDHHSDEAIDSQQLVLDNDSQAQQNRNLEIENQNLDHSDKNHNPSREELFDPNLNNQKENLVTVESTSSSDNSETAANNVIINDPNNSDVKDTDIGLEMVEPETAIIDMKEVDKDKCEPTTSEDDIPAQPIDVDLDPNIYHVKWV